MLWKRPTGTVTPKTKVTKTTGRAKLIDSTRQEDALTNNWALTNSTSLHNVVDMFFLAWAARNMSEVEIIRIWIKALTEDKELAFRCLFWARDIRGWAGERRFFRTIWNSLDKEDIKHYEQFVSTYGRWDDLHDTSLDYLVEKFREGNEKEIGLLAKWTPRKGKVFEYIRKALWLSPKEFRKILVENTNVVEQLMSFRQWGEIDYGKIPSQAFNKYKKAFYRNDQSRFEAFFTEKPEQIKSDTLFPYQLYESRQKRENTKVIDAQWNNLPNYVGDGKSFLPVCDVSGSMSGQPMAISVSLWVYLSERNKSSFKDAFITFSERPTMQYLKGTVSQRFSQLERAHWDMNTDLVKVFSLILDTAVRDNLTQADMPDSILIISDMEFDSACGRHTNYQHLQVMYNNAGLKMPNIVFWNVNGRPWNSPVKYNEKWTALVSGASPAIMKSLLGWEDMTPIWIMLKTLNSERYLSIK